MKSPVEKRLPHTKAQLEMEFPAMSFHDDYVYVECEDCKHWSLMPLNEKDILRKEDISEYMKSTPCNCPGQPRIHGCY